MIPNYNRYIEQFEKVCFVEDRNGFIAWRLGTGWNVELLHLKVDDPRKGIGTKLFKMMLKRLGPEPPHKTVFGFTRVSNVAAVRFYGKMGFDLSIVQGVYKDGEAVVFSQKYEELKRIHL